MNRRSRLLPAVLCLVTASCAPRLVVAAVRGREPSFPTTRQRLRAGDRTCRSVQTHGGRALDLRAAPASHRLRAKLDAGFASPARVRLELPAPGQPIFTYVADGKRATLVLPRDGRVLRDAPPAETLEALAGVAIGPEDLRTIVAGCGFDGRRRHRGARASIAAGWQSTSATSTSWLAAGRGAVAAGRRRARTRSRSATADFVAGRPTTIRLRASPSGGRRGRSGDRPDDPPVAGRHQRAARPRTCFRRRASRRDPDHARASCGRQDRLAARVDPVKRRATRARPRASRQGQPRSARARHARRRLSRAPHRLPVDRTARHAAVHRAARARSR